MTDNFKMCLELTEELEKHKKRINKYKQQLKVKKQECEELKKQYNCYACDTCKGKEDYINLKRHCENAIKSLHSKQAELDQLKAENEDLQEQIRKHNDDMFKNAPEKRFYCKGCTLPYISKKLKQTLTEIKEIAKNGCYDDCGMPLDELSIILQKISECEVE